MKRSVFFWILLFGYYTLAAQYQKPNILLIHTDDHRFSAVGVNSQQGVNTPHIDALAKNGINFSNAYLMGSFSGATCIPSRAMLLTGRNLFQLQGVGNSIPEQHTMIGETLMRSGYFAYHVGKWHQDFKSLSRSAHDGAKVSGKPAYLTDQYRMPFHDWSKEGNYNRNSCYLLCYDDKGKTYRRPFNKADKRGPIGTETTGPHVSEVLAEEATYFIESYKKQQPFFMYLAFPTPHDPRQAPTSFKEMYLEDAVELPPSYMENHPFDNGHLYVRDEQLALWPRTQKEVKKHLSDYYAIITHMDDQIGKIVDALKATGQYDNTLIVFVGDSGLAVGNHGLMGKQNIYDEDGIHIPLMFSGGWMNRFVTGTTKSAFCYNFDIFPTLCEMIGVPVPQSVSGRSLFNVIQGKKDHLRNELFFAYRQHQRAYRKGNLKLIEYVQAPDKDRKSNTFVSGTRITQLFDINQDPWETTNLATLSKYKSVVKKMRKAMLANAKAYNDTADGMRTTYNFWDYFDETINE